MKPHLTLRNVVVGLSLILAAAALSGCASCKPGKGAGKPLTYNLKVAPADSLKDSSVEVDVVGIHPSDLERYKTYSVKKYFKPGDPMRADAAKVTAKFVPGNQKPLLIPSTDPQWAKWMSSGAQYLVVIADLPNVADEGKVGSQDPRRQLVPICECYWPAKTKGIAVEVE